MSYDRYLAICNPLNYFSIMSTRLCHELGIICWLSSYLIAVVYVVPMCTLNFCGPNEMDHFFCDMTPLLELSCSDTSAVEMEAFILSFPTVFCPFLLIMFSYLHIIYTIIKMSSATNRQKAFSTCSSHLVVVCTYYGTLILMYMVPHKSYSLNPSKFLSLLYSVATPLLNPIIYTLRNEEIKVAIVKMTGDLGINIIW
ncbi:olfactory receptor 10A7-like [Bombina bombina]|uniref:olfactory receptor 10A7-like n=1 Tax=Bombina bombina TaxID=8345 RepID=UPI00235B09D0|nr:olfactory receptor 10A7-like [Bombina bombina]